MEIWKDVVGYEGIYQVSNKGRVKRIGKYRNQITEWESNKILKPGVKNNGYLFCQLSKDNKTSPKMIHRLVAEAFIDNPYSKPTVNHIDGNRANNNVSNLEWATYTENNVHSLYELNGYKAGDYRNKRGSKVVLQYDLQGNFIKEYPSYRESQRQTGINAIDVVCRGDRQKQKRQHTAGGYIWKYKDDIQD
jgi:hypothetical protein